MDSYRDPRDNIVSLDVVRKALIERYLKELLATGALNKIQEHYARLKKFAEEVDRPYSSLGNLEILMDYAGRMKFCLDQLNVLKQSADSIVNGRRIDIAETVAAIAFVESELVGMKWTLERILGN